MPPCHCQHPHERRSIVLTGGPGAGKTATLELIRKCFCSHVHLLPESAGIVFGGGFPRGSEPHLQRAAQRAIFYVQRELEEAAAGDAPAILLCDRGTVDGAAYWPGPGELWSALGTTRAEQLARYFAVIHLRTPPAAGGYNQQNPLRIESALEAATIDDRILAAWEGHPNRHVVEASSDFLTKAQAAIAIVRQLLPACCHAAAAPLVDATATAGTRG